MNMELRPLTEAERKYTFSQSQQLFGQTACIGHLRGDMDTDGTGFFTSWDNHCSYLKTDEFKAELDTVINMLRFDERYGGVLKNRSTLAAYCYGNQQSAFDDGSLMLSVANIPMLGMRFTGIIGVVMLDGKEYRIATYLGAKVKHIEDNTVTVKQGDYQLTAKLIKKKAHPLRAPVCGSMSRTIHESAACTAYYRFSYRGDVICEFVSDRASFEFEY